MQIEEVDLGVCRAFVFAGTGRGSAVILPGAGYSIQAPLLWFTRVALSGAGRRVIAVDDRYTRQEDPRSWVEARAKAALDYLGNETSIMVGKSISTLATPLAAERRLPGIWLTPLLQIAHSPVVAGLRNQAAPALLIGGTADGTWDGEVARSFAGAEVLEIPDGDHSLQVEGDSARSLEALRTVVERVERFTRGLK